MLAPSRIDTPCVRPPLCVPVPLLALPPPCLNSCIQRLLADDQSPRGEDVECLCKLLGTVGQQLEQPSVKGKAGMSQTEVRRELPCPTTSRQTPVSH